MTMRNMPAPGEEDMGGNPLQEGILGGQDGGWKNRGVRDESYASVQKDIDPDVEIPAEIVEVVPPEPGSIRPDKKRMDKQADLLNSIEDVAAPVVGGTAGFLVGGPMGAAAGAGLAGAGMDALQGEGAGHALGTGIEDAAMGGLGGLGAGALGGAATTLGEGAAMSGGSAADAAAAGATRGGIGSVMKGAWNAGKNMMLYNSLHDTLLGGGGGQGGGGMLSPATAMPPQAGPAPVQPASYYSRTAAPNSTPSSQDHVPSNDTDDPEDVDFKERNDGAHDKGLGGEQDINDIGGTDTGPDGLFSADSAGLKSLAELLPKVLQFALSDDAGSADPDLQGLHQLLEQENPGYMNDADDAHGTKLLMMVVNGKPMETGDDDLLQDNDEPHDPISEHQATALRPGIDDMGPSLQPGLTNTCPRCGSTMDPSSGHCPQCGIGNMNSQPQSTNPDLTTPQQMMVSKTAGDTQGPNTDEQKALVAQFLQDQGRADEIPNMILEPYKYADELAEITGGDTPPQDIGDQGPPPPVDPSQQGAMPVPGMSTPPAGGPGPGAAPMMSAVMKYAGTVDGVAEKCPKCGSHSTGYTNVEDGKCGCKTCGHHWDSEPLVQNKEAAGHHDDPSGSNPIGVSQADAIRPDDPAGEQDPSHSWVDESGQPLKVGQSYKMYSANYDIPDDVRIDAVKPESIEYTITGEYGLETRTELSHEEAQLENLTFVPSDPGGPDQIEDGSGDLEQNMDDVPRPDAGMTETDLSTPHVQMASTNEPHLEEDNWLAQELVKEGGAKFTPYEQRDFIDEDGMARNSDKLDLMGTHYEASEISDQFLFGL